MFQLLKFVYSQVVFVFCDIKLIIFATVTVFDQSAMVCLEFLTHRLCSVSTAFYAGTFFPHLKLSYRTLRDFSRLGKFLQ